MSWSQRYRNSLLRPRDTTDSIDTTQPSQGTGGGDGTGGGFVSIESIVSPGGESEKGHAPDIQPAPEPETPPAEPIAEPWPDEGEAGIPRRYPGAVAGLLRASQCRPVSWTGAENRPPPGAWCRNCEYGRWWLGLGDGSGWRCWPCHPPDGSAPGTIEEVRT